MSTPKMLASMQDFVLFNDSVEITKPNEEEIFDKLAATMRGISELMNDRARHAYRSVHAKSHGLLKGEFRVANNLPAPYRQGLFASPASYGVLLRFSTNPGDILPDSISTPRGLAIKVIGIQNAEMVPEHSGQTTQDFIFVNGRVFGVPDAEGFLKQVQLVAEHAADSTTLKQAVSTVARLAEATVEIFGGGSDLLKQFGHPETNPLGETYSSLVPMRYGNHLAKIRIEPASANLKQLTNQHVDIGDNFSALRDTIVAFFAAEPATWDVKIQLATDLEKMPVEDASVEWSEQESPYVTVAQIHAPVQNVYSPARRVYFDDILSFNPWHSMADHRPLGNIMRARRKAYAKSSQYRHQMNARPVVEPSSIDEIPD